MCVTLEGAAKQVFSIIITNAQRIPTSSCPILTCDNHLRLTHCVLQTTNTVVFAPKLVKSTWKGHFMQGDTYSFLQFWKQQENWQNPAVQTQGRCRGCLSGHKRNTGHPINTNLLKNFLKDGIFAMLQRLWYLWYPRSRVSIWPLWAANGQAIPPPLTLRPYILTATRFWDDSHHVARAELQFGLLLH